MKYRKCIPLFLLSFACLLNGCGYQATVEVETESETESETETEKEKVVHVPVELTVQTSFGGNDRNAQNYKSAIDAWESTSGNFLTDTSQELSDEYRAKVIDEFENGNEPDIVYFYTGALADEFIENGQVVSIDEIREVYPEYASNMDEAKMPTALDGDRYAVPVNGVWEALYVNTSVLEAAGVELPDGEYTWEAFLEDCKAIKTAKKIPIAVSMAKMPDYWLEYAIFNAAGKGDNMLFISAADDDVAENWISAFSDLKELYTLGYFSTNTLAIDDAGAFKQFINGDAAFFLDGSWRMGDIANACLTTEGDRSTLDADKLAQFTVIGVPGKDSRTSTDLIGGSTMGYYITRKAWEDESKRDALVDFVQTMTTDEMITQFAGLGAQALKEQPDINLEEYNSLQIAGFELVCSSTSWTGTLLNNIESELADTLRTCAANTAANRLTPQNAVQSVLNTQQKMIDAAARESQSKAESESKAKAEKESQAKAESESKAKAESESKAKAESESKAKTESEAAAKK